jgi:hypothetical protein
MDTSVVLVQAYLHVNGYFTVAEYPVLEKFREQARTVTDLDILAFRFAHAGHGLLDGNAHHHIDDRFAVDPRLECPLDRPDMIVGEVKEGAARLNDALRDARVLEVALTRFGCCSGEHAALITAQLLKTGRVIAPGGHSIRLVAFGDAAESERSSHWTTIPMRHVVRFLRMYLKNNWTVFRHAQLRDPALAFLALMEKWGADDPDARPAFRSKERNHGRMRMQRRS